MEGCEHKTKWIRLHSSLQEQELRFRGKLFTPPQVIELEMDKIDLVVSIFTLLLLGPAVFYYFEIGLLELNMF